MLFINKIREENFNVILLNNFMIIYSISLLLSYRISGTIFYIMLFIFLINKNFKNFFLESLNNRVVQAFLLYFLLHFLWVIGSENLENALYQVRKNIILLSPILFYPVIRKEYIEKIFFYLIIVLYFSAIYSILLYFNILSINNTISGEAIPFLYKSDYGFFLLLGIGYSFLKLTQNTNLLFQKVFLLSFILTSSVDIFLIGSRTFMFLYIFAIFLLAIIVYKKQIIKILLFTLFAISLFAIMYTQNSKIKYQIDDIIKGLESSFYEKEYQNSSGIRFIKKRY
jgi:O-antigen ligase